MTSFPFVHDSVCVTNGNVFICIMKRKLHFNYEFDVHVAKPLEHKIDIFSTVLYALCTRCNSLALHSRRFSFDLVLSMSTEQNVWACWMQGIKKKRRGRRAELARIIT